MNIPPDMPTVGRIISQLYQQTTGDRIDGVIAADPLAVAEILRVAGPIQAGGAWMDADNVAEETLVRAYVRYERDNNARRRFLEEVARASFEAFRRSLTTKPVELLRNLDTQFIFSVDSDCRPRSAAWAERHLSALQAAPPDVLATAAPLIPEPSRDWWSQRADITPQPGVDADGAVTYPVGGNRCSRTDLLRTLGGFPAFRADDAALGRRALRAGLRFIWVPNATAYHHNPSGVRGYHRQMRKAAQYATELDGPVPPRFIHGWAARRIARATLGVGKRVLRGQLRERLAFVVKVDAQIRGAMDIWAERSSESSG